MLKEVSCPALDNGFRVTDGFRLIVHSGPEEIRSVSRAERSSALELEGWRSWIGWCRTDHKLLKVEKAAIMTGRVHIYARFAERSIFLLRLSTRPVEMGSPCCMRRHLKLCQNKQAL